jgi:hypothetical protein
MSKSLKIIISLLAVLIIGVLVIGVIGYVLLSRQGSDTVAMSSATAVGVPNGPATTKSIGPAGGSIASTDGRITVTVPPNVVTGPLDFSIQPITNLAQGGRGSAYRLQPDGLKFASPITVSFNFAAPDLKSIVPEGLAVAYQDPTGVWQAFNTVEIDRERKTLTVSTTHFTDYSIWAVRLSPENATLHLRETLEIQLVACLENDSWLSQLRTSWGIQRCDSMTKSTDTHWSVDIGTITPTGPGSAVYQAPAVKPSKLVATVRFVYKLQGSTERDLKDVRTCEIAIVGGGYRASGNAGGDTVFSGDICDLAHPFTLKTNNPFLSKVDFVPSSPIKGTYYFTTINGVTGGGGGEYTITGTDALKTGMELTSSSKGRGPVGPTLYGSGPVHIDLAPLDKECKP